uniref:prostate and testis expressed protein 3 n=1 Tax=Nyctereutes procyonoides TaxID=34880 RepID=UPI002444EA76|nr:prostate and testis expressed protein 3 [Nyctereutes procyonoides]
MDKHFLMVFSLFCCIVAVTPLTCMTCHLRTRTDRCRRGFGICVAQKFESCMTLKIFQDNILQLSYMVCQKFCRDLTFDFNNRTYVHKCCKLNYCNFKNEQREATFNNTRIRSNRSCGNTPNYQEVHKTPFVLPNVRKSEHSGILPYKNASDVSPRNGRSCSNWSPAASRLSQTQPAA